MQINSTAPKPAFSFQLPQPQQNTPEQSQETKAAFDLRSALSSALPTPGICPVPTGRPTAPQPQAFLQAFNSIGLSAALDSLPAPAAPASASRALLEAKNAQRAAEEAHVPARSAVGAPDEPPKKMAYHAALGQKDLDDLASNEHHLRKVSKTKAGASTKQRRRGAAAREKGSQYEERKAGKVVGKERRTNRMAALKHMY
eukprot:TRINITY_DN4001_c0_g1_i1.p1 TRINITY_DN4001_c0_g1~~TRINITY_DN4001_c0_g1_i1.p1  ORF type:complete len:200 (+),score=30.15 TRINITY_DN4001_c0_g1_i1:109-708(+)